MSLFSEEMDPGGVIQYLQSCLVYVDKLFMLEVYVEFICFGETS